MGGRTISAAAAAAIMASNDKKLIEAYMASLPSGHAIKHHHGRHKMNARRQKGHKRLPVYRGKRR